jgi:hypothetical protein
MVHVVLSSPKQKQTERQKPYADTGDEADPIDAVRVGAAFLDQSLCTDDRKDIAGQ